MPGALLLLAAFPLLGLTAIARLVRVAVTSD
jgi:hypothetical protein